MRHKNKRVRFVEADNVGSPRCESYACEMVNTIETPLELERPKTSEFRFYKRTLERVSGSFHCNEQPEEEDSCAKIEEKQSKVAERSHSSWSRHWEKRTLLPTGKFSPLCQSGNPHASQIQASSDLNLCGVEPMWPFISSQVPQSLALKENDMHEITPNSPSNISQVPQIVTSKESESQYQQGQVFSIKRQRLRELAAGTLSLCLDDFLLLGSDAILKLLQRVGIQKDGGSSTGMLSSISNGKHFNGDDTDSDNYVISRTRSSSPINFGDNNLSRSFNATRTYRSKLGSPAHEGMDPAVPILFSSSGSFIAPMDSSSFSLGRPDFFTWDTEIQCNGQYSVDEMMLDSIGCTSDHKFLGIYEPFHVTRPTMGGIGKFTEAERRRRFKYYTATDMSSDFASLDRKTLPYVRWEYLNEPLIENCTYNLEEMDSEDIINGFEDLNTKNCCRRLLLDGNYRTGKPDELVPKSSIAHMASESFVKWLCDIGIETLSSPLKFPFQSQSYTLQSGLLPEISSRDFYSSYNMVSPWREHMIEDDNFQYDEQPFLKCSVESCHYLPRLESPRLIRPYDVNNGFLCTPSTSKHMSKDVVCASWKYLLPPPGVDLDMKNQLALDYS